MAASIGVTAFSPALTTRRQLVDTSGLFEKVDQMSTCEPIAYEDAPASRFQLQVTAAVAGGTFSDGYALGTIGIALTLAREPLRLDSIWMGMLAGASLAGLFVGSLLLGPLADRIGRRPLLAPTMAAFALTSVLQFFVVTPSQLLILRLILGLALGVDYVVGTTTLAEFSSRQTRGRLLSFLVFVWSLGYSAAFFFGTLVAAARSDSWRWILLSSAIPSAAVFFLRLKIPESPFWLVQRGRIEDARRVVGRYMGADVRLPEVPSGQPMTLRKAWSELFSTRYRRRTAVGAVLYTSQVIPYFALGTYIPIVFAALGITSTYAGGIVYNVFMLLGSAVGLWLIDRLSRRQFIVGALYSSAALLLVLVLPRQGPFITVGAAAAFAFVLAASTSLDFAYLPELFPTRLRASGVGIGTAASRIGAAFGTFMLPTCMDLIGIKPSLAICVAVLALGGAFCQRFAPETRGHSIEEL